MPEGGDISFEGVSSETTRAGTATNNKRSRKGQLFGRGKQVWGEVSLLERIHAYFRCVFQGVEETERTRSSPLHDGVRRYLTKKSSIAHAQTVRALSVDSGAANGTRTDTSNDEKLSTKGKR